MKTPVRISKHNVRVTHVVLEHRISALIPKEDRIERMMQCQSKQACVTTPLRQECGSVSVDCRRVWVCAFRFDPTL